MLELRGNETKITLTYAFSVINFLLGCKKQ